MIFRNILIYLFLFFSNSIYSQEIILKGRVVDNKSGSSLQGVNVKVGSKATLTDTDGKFYLSVQLKSVIESGINFSCIGYQRMSLIYQPKHFYEVKLAESTIQLREVMVGAGDDIIKKAIKNIPKNYSNKPTVIKGILRIQSRRNNSEYFKSDALIKAYIPSYNSNEKTTVTVLENRIDSLYDKSIRYLRHSSQYNVVEFQDIVKNKYYLNKIAKKKKFDYWLVGKQVYNNHKVYVINTSFKDTTTLNDKIDATFYIDTVTYAFVAANIFRYNIKWGSVLPIDVLNHQVVYEKIGEKWYLKETHASADFVLNKQSPKTIVDFIRTELDSINVEKIPYTDIVQNSDNVLVIDKYSDDLVWAKNKQLFEKAEIDGIMANLSNELLDTIKNNNKVNNSSDKVANKQFGRKVYSYLTNNNVRTFYGLIKTPFVITSQSFFVSEPINYAVGFGFDARVFKNLFLGFQTYSNLYNKKEIELSTIGLNLSTEIILNKTSRNFIIKPSIGFDRFKAAYQNSSLKFHSLAYRLLLTYELTHKKAFFLSSGYNTSLNTEIINDLIFTPNRYSFGLGIVLK